MKAVKIILPIVLVVALVVGAVLLLPKSQESTETSPSSTVPPSSTSTGPVIPEITTITIAEALELCGEEGNVTTERYYIRATISSVTNAQYGAMVLTDETGSISVYNSANADGSVDYADMEQKPVKGDTVLVSCILQNYNGNKEIKSAWIIEFTAGIIDEAGYTAMSVADARNAAEGTKVKVTGVVAQITYAFGQVPTGVYLVDDSNSILIHDKDLAQRVRIGNTIEVLAEKTMWILDKEQSYAEKFGYLGSCQLENATLVSNDERTDISFDRSWIPTSTVKEILDTPVSENITNTIYKVNALVKKAPGNGFTNYYFYDLDGTTGAYTYTQCNGSDFAWLDAFDGKICTVYLSVINAKATAADCFFRLQPIQVLDEGFRFDAANTGAHVVKYYGLEQFASTYQANPALELMTTVSSDLLGFQEAKLSYTSSDVSVIEFVEENGKVIMHCLKSGKAIVTVTGTYDGVSHSETMEITVDISKVEVSYLTIAEALKKANGDTVTVKGIVGPSLVNKVGFYLIDNTGVISILLDSSLMETVKVGDEVILEGTLYLHGQDSSKQGQQTRIQDCKIISNSYGNHEYSTDSFITGKTVEEFYKLSNSEDHSTKVYIITGTVVVERTPYSVNYKITDGTTSISLYSAGKEADFAFLLDYEGQEVTLEIAPCNWNDKSYYRGCVLAVYTEDGKICNEKNFKN